MSNSNLTKLLEFFELASTKTFQKTRAGRFTPGRILTALGIWLKLNPSMYSSRPLEAALKDEFREASLFAPAMSTGGCPGVARVAVTSAKNLGKTTCLISNYNYPGGENFEREEDPAKDMKIWEAALATSAAPWYLPPFIKNDKDYWDGATYANCPAETAYVETKALWPRNGASLDILVSLGTGMQKPRKEETAGTAKDVLWGFLATAKNALQRQTDSKEGWNAFANIKAPASIRYKLRRIDPPLGGESRIELDDFKRMAEAKISTKNYLGPGGDGRVALEETAHMLLANLFFFELEEMKTHPADDILEGTIRCRLEHNSQPLQQLLAKVNVFAYMSTVQYPEEEGNGPNWKSIPKTISTAARASGLADDSLPRFRLPVTLRDRQGGGRPQVIALNFVGMPDKTMFPISGFPARVSELKQRANQRWLQ
jgi:hypothetical protein